MKTSSHQTENKGQKGTPSTKLALAGLATLLLISSFAVVPLRASTYNDVQVFVTTSTQLPYSYTYVAYNSSGSEVASYQANYPAAAFELPGGEYLFTVSAVYQGLGYCVCVNPPAPTAAGSSNTSATQGKAIPVNSTLTETTTKGNTTGVVLPPTYKIYEPESEYGFAVADVASSQTLNIQTINVTKFPIYQVTVNVSFINGSAVDGAYVSASIIGQWDYWWGYGSNVNMSAQTGADGTATLTLPVAPSLITAWKWVSLNLPTNQTTPVSIGGQKTNVTEIWGLAYVGLSGSATLIPPADHVDITIQYQQPVYWAEPMNTQVAPGVSNGTTSGTVASTPTGTPTLVLQTTSTASGQNEYYEPSQIGALGAVTPKPGAGSLFGSSEPYLMASGLVGVAVVFGVIAATVLGRSKSQPGPVL